MRRLLLAASVLSLLSTAAIAQGPINPPVGVPFYASAGTVSLPSHSFTNDRDTGFYNPAANTVALALGGTRYGFWDTSHFFYGLQSGQFIGTENGSVTSQASIALGFNSLRFGDQIGRNGGNVAMGPNTCGSLSPYSVSSAIYSMTCLGELAGSLAGIDNKSTYVGSSVGMSILRGASNAILGRGSFAFTPEGNYITGLGHAAGFFNVSSIKDIYIGQGAGVPWTGIPPRITASQSTTTLNVSIFTAGDAPLAVGMVCVSTTATALASNITITSFIGGSGGTGTYGVTPSQSVTSQTMSCGAATQNNIVIGDTSGSLGYPDTDNIVIGNTITPVSASHITVIGKGQTGAYISGRQSFGSAPAAISNAAGVTYSVAQFLGGYIKRSGAIAVSDTTPTAAQIVAGFPYCEDGKTSADLWIRNSDTGLLTIVAGDASVTLDGTTTAALTSSRLYRITVTTCAAGSEAVTVSGVMTAAN